MRAAVLACVLLLLPPAAPAQNAPPEQTAADQPTFRTGVGIVRVDVTVTGRQDQPVTDLTAADFEVREDGILQTIQTLQFVHLTGIPAPDDDLSLEIRSPEHAAQEAARDDVRLLVIFVDDYHLRNGPLFDVRLKQMLRRFIEAEMRPMDLFAVMGPLTPISDLKLTRRKRDLFDRIDKVQGRLGGFVPPRSVLEENQFALNPRQRARIRAEVTLSALQAAAVHLGGLREGRKSVLFVSEGPPLRADDSNLHNRLREVVTAANTSNVTIHTLDPRELGASRWMSDANAALAADTGGRQLARSNDHSRGLRAVMADASAYYLLGYVPERDAADGKFHQIDVRVRRNGVRVIARKGYWAPREEDLRPAPTVSVPREITDAFGLLADAMRPRTALDWTSVGPVDAGRSLITIACEPSAAFPEGRTMIGVTVQIIDAHGAVVETHKGVRTGDDLWLTRFRIPPGSFKARIVVQDADDKPLDTWTRDLHVPEAGEVAAWLGTPVVYRARTAVAHRALAGGGDALPTLERRFRRTDRVLVRWPLSAAAGPAGVRAELVNGRGQTLVALPVSGPAGLPQVDLPLANLAASRYLLRLTASFDDGSASHLVPFAVTP
jgi:VWFA-related protein